MCKEDLPLEAKMNYGLDQNSYIMVRKPAPCDADLNKLFDWYKNNLKTEEDYRNLDNDFHSELLGQKLKDSGFEWALTYPEFKRLFKPKRNL
tara:strand:+ start:569 stop:844 length:276 start_codon:yes stop_codon:yes gene_type:complete